MIGKISVKRYFCLFVIVCIVNSCAWNRGRINQTSTVDSGQIIGSFDTKSADFKKFTEENEVSDDADAEENIPESSAKSSEHEQDPLKKEKNEKLAKEKAEKEKLEKELQTKEKNKKKKVESPGPVVAPISYPADFPSQYIEYDKLYEKYWKSIKPIVYVGEVMEFNVKYFGAVAGKIIIKTMPKVMLGDKKAYHFYAKVLSAPFYKYIYTVDDSVESYVDTQSFRPMKYVLIQRESKQKVDDLQLFDFDKLKYYYWYNRIKKNSDKKEHMQLPIPRYIQDSFTGIMFVRGLPLKIGDIYEFPIITRGNVWLIRIKVEREENITIQEKQMRALRLVAQTHFPGVLNKKSGETVFWYSADAYKKFLKFEASVKIGTLSGELVRYQNDKTKEVINIDTTTNEDDD